MKDSLSVKGSVHILLVDENGNVKHEEFKDNLVVTAGKAFVASALIAASATPFTHVAIGTSSTAAALNQTALVGTELARVAATTSNPTTVTTLFSASFSSGVGTGTIEEAGIFNDPTTGTMFSRYLTGTFVKAAGDTLTLSWTITVA